MLHADFETIPARRFFELPLILRVRKLSNPVPYRRVATAIHGNPRLSKGDIFAIGENEYLVPEKREHDDSGRLVSHTVRLDLAKQITSRPHGTRQISEMTFEEGVLEADRPWLEKAVAEWNPPNSKYAVYIIHPQL